MAFTKLLKNRFGFYFAVLIAAFFSNITHANSTQTAIFENVQTGSHYEKARIILQFDKKIEYKLFFLKDPSRLVIDTQKIKMDFYPEFANLDFNFLKNIRFGKINDKTNRIVFDLTRPVIMKSISETKKDDGTGFKIILDFIFSKNIEENKKLFQTKGWEKYSGIQKKQKKKEINQTKIQFSKNNKYTIVIDPGHGGIDPGAVNGKTYEKDINLRISKMIAKDLIKMGIFNVYLTRKDDRFISLRERFETAENLNAILFISIHADANPNKNLSGASVYTLSNIGKKSQSSKLEDRNNLSFEIEFDNEENFDKANSYLATLAKMSFKSKNKRSEIFAKEVAKSFKRSRIKTLRKIHRKANFHVLKSFIVPSVLIEAGYMSNKYDMVNLKNNNWIQKFSRSISFSILNYLQVSKR